MRLFPKPLEIGEFEGFTEEKDIFGRKNFGEGLQRLFERVEDPMTVILDAPWGAGKTTFINMWCGHMRLNGFPVIYFDAFKHDYLSDAFTALAGEVFAQAENYHAALLEIEKNSEEESTSDSIEKLKEKVSKFASASWKFGKNFAKRTTKGLVRTGIKKALGEEEVKEIEAAAGEFVADVCKGICEDESNAACEYLDDLLNDDLLRRNQQRDSLEQFKSSLSLLSKELGEIAQKLAEVNGGKMIFDDKCCPLIFVVDELDRCKPPFALALIETIKHFFAQESVHFLLVTHVEQLESSVGYNYGAGIDSRTYLQKFYNVILQLPAGTARLSPAEIYLDKLRDTIPVVEGGENSEYRNLFLDFVYEYYQDNHLELRTLEKICTQMGLAFATTPPRFAMYVPLTGVLALMSVLDVGLFQKALRKDLTLKEVFDFMQRKIPETTARLAEEPDWVLTFWCFCLGNEEQASATGLSSMFNKNGFYNRREVLPYVCGQLAHLNFTR